MSFIVFFYFIKINYLILKIKRADMSMSTSIYPLLGVDENETKV